MEYKDTLNLPKTDFPMKANLPQNEPKLLKMWEEMDIYAKVAKARKDCKKYILHDGPPYSNGHIHIGHALNKTLKDIVVKHRSMNNLNCDFIPGWDCHGLPVEHELFKKLNKKKGEINQLDFRQKAGEYAMGFVEVQKEEFKRLGVFGNWQNPYLTLDKEYEVEIIKSLAALTQKGYIYKGLKPVNWCYRCETALAEAEVEYEDHTSPSVYVKFKVQKTEDRSQRSEDTYILIWTTTPWTLIANVAVAVHPEFEYVTINTGKENLILAKELLAQVAEKAALKDYKIVKAVKGKELEGLKYEHPFGLREGKVVLADYVSTEDGTGCVHTAPGHGQEDFQTGIKYKLEIVMPIDEKGNFNKDVPEFGGMNVHKANSVITERLKDKGLLLHSDNISHSYPHCWRCKNPVIFRATEQWFMSIDHLQLRERMLSEIKKVKWIPAQGEERISSMVQTRPDWCLSRQRYWGVPIPVFMCKKCRQWIADPEIMEHFADIVKEKGSNAWFELSADELLPAGYKCLHKNCAGAEFIKGEDIVDVWFESGVSHQAVMKQRQTLGYPADLYLEGSDQHRGWFQSALITSMAIEENSAFKSVLTHGFVVDGEGRKMSKSLGNVISPQEIIKDYGADILRLWAASCDYNDDVRISGQIVARLVEAYRKIRNTARFMLSNLYDFSPEKDTVKYNDMPEIDKWAISRARNLLKEINSFYENFEFHKVYHTIYNFCIIDMSNFYLDILKDRLYTFKAAGVARRSCQTAIYEILNALVASIAPVMVFTAEEIWQNMPKRKDMPGSVHMALWPAISDIKEDGLAERWQGLKDIRDNVLKKLEEARTSGIIRSSLEAKVLISAKDENYSALLERYKGELASIFIVSQVELKGAQDSALDITVKKADGAKCIRCWNYSTGVGTDAKHPQICPKCLSALN